MFPQIFRRLQASFSKRHRDRVLDEELRTHLSLLIEQNIARGMSPQAARRAAKLALGGADQIKESVHDHRGLPLLDSLAQDIRFAFRMLRKSPGFTIVAVLTLALGIGANTAIFSLVDYLILQPLPIHQPDKVAILFSTLKNAGTNTTFSYRDYVRIQEQASSIFTDISAGQPYQMDGISLGGKSQPMWSAYVDGNFFSLLGIKPALGRLILPSEGKVIGADPVLVISYAFWKSHFNGDRSVIGRKASVNGHPVTIVGITPEGFHGLSNLIDTQGYIPLAMAPTFNDAPSNFQTDETDSSLNVIARLKPDVSIAQVQPALRVIAQRLSEQNHNEMTISAVPLGPASLNINPTNPNVVPMVSALFLTLAAALLCLACMNIANLCLARAATRQHEVAMRSALGATRGRLIRQLLTESLLLAVLGAIGGIALGIIAARWMGSISMHTVLPTVFDFRFDWRVFVYALIAALFATALVGITPALRAARGNLTDILRESGRTSTGNRQRLRTALVIAQVGSSLMLLIVAGLFVRSLEKAQHSDLGFDPTHLLNVTIDTHEVGYNEDQTLEFRQNLLQRARALPGVKSASLADAVPMGYNNWFTNLNIEGYTPPPNGELPAAGYNRISSGYFATMRIPLLQGRSIQDSDTQKSLRVAVVNQKFVDQFWHGQNPIGRRFSTTSDPKHLIEVVGVAKNSRDDDMFTADEPFFYVPLTQDYNPMATLQLRTFGAPDALAPEVVNLIHSLEPDIPVFDVQPMTVALDTANGFLLFQFAAAVAGALGLIGLVLAIVGVYGVISYSAGQRTHEIGIRMALGAQPRQILSMILTQGLVIVGIGVAVGIMAAAALAKLVGNFLFGIAPLDPLTYIAASILLALIALLASFLPARRATRVHPMVALRYE
jgi:predicted permease